MTRKHLERRLVELNKMLNRPTEHTMAGNGMSNAGCLFLEHNVHYGYKIVEMLSKGGGEKALAEGMSLKEASQWVQGAYWMHHEVRR